MRPTLDSGGKVHFIFSDASATVQKYYYTAIDFTATATTFPYYAFAIHDAGVLFSARWYEPAGASTFSFVDATKSQLAYNSFVVGKKKTDPWGILMSTVLSQQQSCFNDATSPYPRITVDT